MGLDLSQQKLFVSINDIPEKNIIEFQRQANSVYQRLAQNCTMSGLENHRIIQILETLLHDVKNNSIKHSDRVWKIPEYRCVKCLLP